jgi:beta-glucosidase
MVVSCLIIHVAAADDPANGIRGLKMFGGQPTNCIIVRETLCMIECKAERSQGGIALAATFDVDLAEELGRFMGEEAAAKGVHIWLGPAMNNHVCQ